MEFVKCFTLQDSRNLKFRPKKRIHHDIFGEKMRMQDVSIFPLCENSRGFPEQKDILHQKKIFYTNDICAKLAKTNNYPGKKVFIF